MATLDTGEAKDYSFDPETLERRWHAQAADLGFTPGIDRVLLRSPNP